MSITTENVKLYTYEIKGEQTIVESFEAESWDKFVIVKIPSDTFELEPIGELMMSSFPGKQILFVGSDDEISFYGVQPVNPSLFSKEASNE